MVQATISEETSSLVPVPPEWMQRQGRQAPSTNRNINDIYWAKGPYDADPGWIIVGPSAVPGADGRPLTRQAERWIRKGRTPLIDYSYTDRVSPNTGHRETIETNADRLSTVDRYYWLFKNGGAHLFPIEQVVAHHWHITPPYGLTAAAFPQLRQWEVPLPFWCGACATPAVPYNSSEELLTHLLITHRMTLPGARDLMASYDMNTKPRGRRGLMFRRKVEEAEGQAGAVAVSPDQPQGKLVVCVCGQAFGSGIEKFNHQRRGECSATSQPADAMSGQAEE